MKKLYSPKVVREIIDLYDFSFKKSLGQNFLIDKNFVDKIVDAAEIEGENVLEIGPGIGTISYEMAKTAKKVVVIEIDKSLIPILEQNLEEFDNVKIINEDILKVDLAKLVEEEFAGESFKVVSNLPYYITTPIIERLITTGLPCSDMTIMVQKEVGQRMVASEVDKEYSSLSVFIRFYTEAKTLVNLPKSVFMPQPKIDSTILNLKLRIYDKNVDQETLFKLVRAGFNKRRKTILNSMSDVVDKEDLKVAFEKTGLKANLRAENLSIDDYINLANELTKQ
ncbi:16S rRNA (adenine(1518)-N(6)/adenine(1519)-N(6))-dimethyltransferase RsmA [uncultured Anaerococcus sp.]|uniref:16S rRNA (adenine(1518)-N(6)/adenine(1519)-N(6))- dimethyltransferase RsmA n=1 Tax=uncultured Anaerococcus sp. TaxID=293428 RepID=UPI0026284FC2|nr:16S rRNA (adenine(1518)-N(6)/adenine(1519)-N(6))-dimethyltransferase RsmA [uncultured Anaerococcus sp.]